jgi:hypothetical protein
MAGGASDAGGGTIVPLGRTHPPATAGKSKPATIILALAAATVLAVSAVAAILHKSAAAPVPGPLQTAVEVRSAATAPPPSPVLEPVDPPASAPPLEPSAAPYVSPAHVPAPRRPPAGASVPNKPRPNCDPNFYLDAQGEKHFKPECFR